MIHFMESSEFLKIFVSGSKATFILFTFLYLRCLKVIYVEFVCACTYIDIPNVFMLNFFFPFLCFFHVLSSLPKLS